MHMIMRLVTYIIVFSLTYSLKWIHGINKYMDIYIILSM